MPPRKAISTSSDEGHEGRRRRTSCRRPSVSRCSTTTARSGRSNRCTSSSPSRSTASRRCATKHPEWKKKQPFKAVHRGRHARRSLARRRERRCSRSWPRRTPAMTTEEFDDDRRSTGSPRRGIRDERPLHRDGLSADARTARRTCGPTASRRSSSPAAGSSSCGRVDREASTASRRSRSLARRARRSSSCKDGKPALRDDSRTSSLIDDKDAASRSASHRSSAGGRSMAFGNSDGDFADARSGRRREWGRGFGLIVHHTDAEREWRVRPPVRTSAQLDKGLDEADRSAAGRSWSMKNDWKTVFRARLRQVRKERHKMNTCKERSTCSKSIATCAMVLGSRIRESPGSRCYSPLAKTLAAANAESTSTSDEAADCNPNEDSKQRSLTPLAARNVVDDAPSSRDRKPRTSSSSGAAKSGCSCT